MTPTQLLFQDWGQPAILRETVPYYDPDTGQMEESESESNIVVISGQQTHQPLAATAAMASQITHSFLVQSDELPASLHLQNTQLVLMDHTFAILETTSSPITTLTVLQCADITCSTSS